MRSRHFRCASTWPLLLFCSTAALAGTAPSTCQRTLRLAAAPAPSPGAASAAGPLIAPIDQPIEATAQSLDMTLNGDADFKGGVTLHVGEMTMTAPELHYDASANRLIASGAITLVNPNLRIEGSSGRYGDDGAEFASAKFQLLKQPGRGQAGSIRLTPADTLELADVSYTTCPPGSSDWELRAAHISLDVRRQRGVGRGSRVVFKGVPVMYLPWLSFPISDARQTGFLFPAIGSSSSAGATLALPWYWNIAPNRDLTLTGNLYSRRGVGLGTEYRQLDRSGRSELRVDYLPHDSHSGGSRSYEKLNMDYRLGQGGWLGQVAAEHVSDVHYFEDFERGTRSSNTAFLTRHLSLSYRDAHWRVYGELRGTQTLDETLAGTDRPYSELPRIAALGRWGRDTGLQAELESETAWFRRPDSVAGGRLDLGPALQWNLASPSFYFRPRAAWQATWYRLHDPLTGGDSSPSRQLPVYSLDTALSLFRPASTGHRTRMTLVPRAYYVYIPYRAQDALPLFDTGLPDPNFVTLFRPNRYIGADRVGDTNSLALGVTLNAFDDASGSWRLRATLGQRFQFSDPRVRLPTEPAVSRRASNLIANVDLRAWNHVTLKLDAAWDRDNSRIEKLNSEWQYRGSASQLLNVGYRYSRGNIQQGDVSFAWPLGRRWSVYGLTAYSLRDHQTTTRFSGLRFRGDCWGMSLVASSSVSTRTGARDTGFYLQLELNGLSSVGSDADSFLRNSIRGYSDNAP